MKTHPLAITLSVAFLTCAAIPALAQQPPGGSMMPQAGQKQTEQSSPDHGGMMGGGMMGRGGMSQGMMGHRGMMNPIAMRIIFALMDTDGDGTVSLQEWQAAYEKIFKAMDADHDGTVSFEEMMNFMRGTKGSAPH